jgi:hypothetical protein
MLETMVSSGETAAETTTADPVTLFSVPAMRGTTVGIFIYNGSANAGLFRVGTNQPWCYLPSRSPVSLRNVPAVGQTVQIKRIDTDDLSDVWGWAM